MPVQTLGQIYNVLLIIAITAIMAIVTTVLAFFVDLIPSAFQGFATPNNLLGAQIALGD